jgi:hypothetical protein
MIRMRALQTFPLSGDGIHVAVIAQGAEFNCPEQLVDGLIAALYCEPIDAPEGVQVGPEGRRIVSRATIAKGDLRQVFPGAGTEAAQALIMASRPSPPANPLDPPEPEPEPDYGPQGVSVAPEPQPDPPNPQPDPPEPQPDPPDPQPDPPEPQPPEPKEPTAPQIIAAKGARKPTTAPERGVKARLAAKAAKRGGEAPRAVQKGVR